MANPEPLKADTDLVMECLTKVESKKRKGQDWKTQVVFATKRKQGSNSSHALSSAEV